MGIKVNLQGVSTEMGALPAGRYPATVYSIESKESSAGNPMLVWTFKVSADHEEYGGRNVWHNTSLLKQALFNLKRIMIALGDDPAGLETEIEFEADDYIGRPCVIETKVEKYQGEDKTRLVRVLPEDAPLDMGTDVSDALVNDLI